MKTIIAGSRDFLDYEILCAVIDSCPWEISTIICGKAKGVDTLGEQYGKEFDIPIEYFPANWKQYGLSAGHIRNKQMSDNATALIAIWDGESRGTKNMIATAIAAHHKIMIYDYKQYKLYFK